MNVVELNHEAVVDVAIATPPSIAILLKGETGIGKTAIARQVAKRLNLPVIDMTTSNRTETDFIGLPIQGDVDGQKMTVFAPPAELMRAVREPVVLFLDEINRGLGPVRNAAQRLVAERCFGCREDGTPYFLHEDTRVIAAINEGSAYTDAEMLDAALVRRFMTIHLVPNVLRWAEWAKTQEHFDPVMVEFLVENPSSWTVSAETISSRNEGAIFPTPAGWENVARLLHHNNVNLAALAAAKSNLPQYLVSAISGLVGTDVQATFTQYIRNYVVSVDPLDVLRASSEEAAETLMASLVGAGEQSALFAFKSNIEANLSGWIRHGTVQPLLFVERLPVIINSLPKEQRTPLINKIKSTFGALRNDPSLSGISFHAQIVEPLSSLLVGNTRI